MQLQAGGGTAFEWLPPTGLSAANIPDPVARFSDGYGSIRYQVRVLTPEGCFDTTSVLVQVFATAPNVFVPTAFTPNGDGLNDVLRPIGAGVLRIERFAIFNRWGQQLFADFTGRGWDGRLSGQLQQSGAYVWIVQATDYEGRKLIQKGTSLLIR
jgi:gliding motility-associated-like protein